jgi:hypothetical protein
MSDGNEAATLLLTILCRETNGFHCELRPQSKRYGMIVIDLLKFTGFQVVSIAVWVDC